MFLHLDCIHYRGDRPCDFHRLCEECPHYAPMGPRVLIVKLGALGDVLRTGCLLPTLAAQSEPAYVTWVTSAAARPLVERMPGVHRVLTFDFESTAHLLVERFDMVISLDKEPAPCALAMRVEAEQKLGIGLSRYGTAYPLNDECDYYFRLGLDDEEKFRRNRKTYPQLIHEALGMQYEGRAYTLQLREGDRAQARARFETFAPPDEAMKGSVWIGINPGAGNVFAHKAWREEGYVELIRALARRRPETRFLLLGGLEDEALMDRIAAGSAGAPVFQGGADNPLGGFAALVDRCAVVVSGDTLAMHLALALGRRSVAIFGPTCAQEIEMFGRGVKIVSPIECSPCYKRACDFDPHCMDKVKTETVVEAAVAQLDATTAVEVPAP
jgi:heptosyltransferase-2